MKIESLYIITNTIPGDCFPQCRPVQVTWLKLNCEDHLKEELSGLGCLRGNTERDFKTELIEGGKFCLSVSNTSHG